MSFSLQQHQAVTLICECIGVITISYNSQCTTCIWVHVGCNKLSFSHITWGHKSHPKEAHKRLAALSPLASLYVWRDSRDFPRLRGNWQDMHGSDFNCQRRPYPCCPCYAILSCCYLSSSWFTSVLVDVSLPTWPLSPASCRVAKFNIEVVMITVCDYDKTHPSYSWNKYNFYGFSSLNGARPRSFSKITPSLI